MHRAREPPAFGLSPASRPPTSTLPRTAPPLGVFGSNEHPGFPCATRQGLRGWRIGGLRI
eukprot:9127477-Alexandrium_andersonii.AAC.1